VYLSYIARRPLCTSGFLFSPKEGGLFAPQDSLFLPKKEASLHLRIPLFSPKKGGLSAPQDSLFSSKKGGLSAPQDSLLSPKEWW